MMGRGLRALCRLGRRARREDGAATVEFVIAVPILLMVFMAAFEAGLLMTRSMMLEQAVDRTMRSLRLGLIPNPTIAQLRADICNKTVIFPDCRRDLTIELRRIDTATWALPPTQATCRNRRETIDPAVSYSTGGQNDIMLVRVCISVDPMFPTTGLGLALPKRPDGGYGLLAVSAFVNEPS